MSDPTSDLTPPTRAELRLAAMNLLARREHSALELRDKLQRRFGEQSPVAERLDEALAGLARDNLQSDERFAEAFVTMRQRQGKGPMRIYQELRHKGVSDALIAAYLDPVDEDTWRELAREVLHKRFGSEPAETLRERAKQQRFLQYRGFSHEQIRSAMEETATP